MSAPSNAAIDGRAVSRARRHALSAGKAALPAVNERVRVGSRSATGAETPQLQTAKAAPAPGAAVEPVSPASSNGTPAALVRGTAATGRLASVQRRGEQSRIGRGDAPPAQPTRPPRIGKLDYAPKVVASQTQAGGHVTGVRLDRTRHVTGDERGLGLPVSGTQYIGADSGAAWRAGGPKVGHARTEGGAIVSGTLVRSMVAVTGDEAGRAITITGEADGRLEDDLTQRSSEGASPAAQFARQTDPHGHSVHTNLARSARSFGSRQRDDRAAIEATEGGHPVTGSAIGRSIRVTGDEAGSCRQVTGDQYLAPARRQAECGGGAPAAQIRAGRPDPVTGTKVTIAHTWTGRRVSGIDVEHNPRVTGSEPGACAAVTGSPYQGPRTTYSWCEDGSIDEAERRLLVRTPASAVTGDTPLNDALVTGTARGAVRDITGTPYYREAVPAVAAPEQPVALIDERFSIRSPQRSAHLRAGSRPNVPSGGERITGSFAIGIGKLTGNLEFAFRPRQSANGGAPASARITGEGRTTGRVISGQAWKEQGNVTGTEGAIAGARNPSERGSKPRPFAGAGRFKALASSEDPKHLVTGTFGYSSDTAAKVTLSGGAQG
jgi:hypothetical protein